MSYRTCKYQIMGVYYRIDIIMSLIIFTKKGVCYEEDEKSRDVCSNNE
jgi:hypothetical protein